MKTRLLLLCVALFLFFPKIIKASYTSDYDFQKLRYKESYAEFKILKKDYLEAPTLDNLQKSMIAARQSIKSRNLAMMSFIGMHVEQLDNDDPKELDPVKIRLSESYDYYQTESDKSDTLTTLDDFIKTADEYRSQNVRHLRAIRYGQIAIKLKKLYLLNLRLQENFDNLLPQLPDNIPTIVTTRVEEIKSGIENTNRSLISAMASIIPENEDDIDVNSTSVLSKWLDKLSSYRTTEVAISEKIIDLEKNYARNN